MIGITLPSIYLDNVQESAFSGILVANEFPERDSVGASSSGKFRVDALCTNGNSVDISNTTITVDGVQAFNGSAWVNSFTGTEARLPDTSPLLADWRMEESGVTSWTVGSSAVLTKVSGAPGGHGTQVLHIAPGASNPYAYQSNVVTSGESYRITGWARGDGSVYPSIRFGGTDVWIGTTSSTWQAYSVEVTSQFTGYVALRMNGSSGWVEFDDVEIRHLGTDVRFEGQAPASWTSEQVISIRVQSQDDGPTDTVDFTYSFTVEDLIGPTVVFVMAIDHSTLRVTFSEAMLAVSASAGMDALNPGSYDLEFVPANDRQAAVWATISAVSQESTTTYDLTTDIPLTFNKTYQLTVDVKDASGNEVSPLTNSYNLTSWQPPGWDAVHCPRFYDFFSPDMQRRDTGDLERLCSVLQDQWEFMVYDAYRFPADVIDHETAPEDQIDLMLADMGNPFRFNIEIDQKRQLLEMLTGIYSLKGAEPGIKLLADFFVGVEITDVRPYTESSWIMGVSELGIETYLGPSQQANLYSFEVVVDTVLTDEQRRQLIILIDYIKAAHEHAYIVEPTDPEFIDHWEMGFSLLGVNTYLH